MRSARARHRRTPRGPHHARPGPDHGHAAGGAQAASGGGADVVSRDVAFSLVNANSTADACSSDGRTYRVRGQLVGPRREVLGANADRVDVLVHGLGTGSWLWHLREQPAYDYAAGLARAGETSLVLDRLGYGASPIPGGNDTCLGAQADMLHQVVQHLHSGLYRFAGRATPCRRSTTWSCRAMRPGPRSPSSRRRRTTTSTASC